MTTIYETIYKKLLKLAPNLWMMEPGEASKSKLSAPMMDLNLDVLSKRDNYMIIVLSHYYEQNGDIVPDPDMEIRVYQQGVAEALAYQDAFGYSRVYAEDENRFYLKRKKVQNSFLNKWLSCVFFKNITWCRTNKNWR